MSNCTCAPGYFSNTFTLGWACYPNNPCINSMICFENATCNNTGIGEFTCNCKNGYQYVQSGPIARSCLAINSCNSNNGGCLPGFSCNSTGPGTNNCICNNSSCQPTSCLQIDATFRSLINIQQRFSQQDIFRHNHRLQVPMSELLLELLWEELPHSSWC